MYNVEICTKCNKPLTWSESARQEYDHNLGEYYEVFEDVQYCERCDYAQNEEEE